MLEKQVGKEEAKHRIVAITDQAKGALRSLATKEGYKTFVIPDNVGGRFSVLTPVGLLPIVDAMYEILYNRQKAKPIIKSLTTKLQ